MTEIEIGERDLRMKHCFEVGGRGHEPRNAGSSRNYKRQGNGSSPWSLQEQCSSANNLILAL